METTKEIINESFELIQQDNKIIENLKAENDRLKSENQELLKVIDQLVEEHCSLTTTIAEELGQESIQNIANFVDRKRINNLLKEVFEK